MWSSHAIWGQLEFSSQKNMDGNHEFENTKNVALMNLSAKIENKLDFLSDFQNCARLLLSCLHFWFDPYQGQLFSRY